MKKKLSVKGRYRSSPLYWERVAPEESGDGTLNARIVAGGHLLSLLLKEGGAERRKIECLAEA